MSEDLLVDPEALRGEVREKYRAVALKPDAAYHFHTGRPLAARLGYDQGAVDALPDRAVESFAGVGNPFSLRPLDAGEDVVDVGSGAGFDSFIAARQVGPAGRVVGVDMTAAMLDKSRATAQFLGYDHVEFREGLAEALPAFERRASELDPAAARRQALRFSTQRYQQELFRYIDGVLSERKSMQSRAA